MAPVHLRRKRNRVSRASSRATMAPPSAAECPSTNFVVERTLQHGRLEGVVHREQRARCVRHRRNGRYVRQFQRRVGGRLHEHQACLRPQRGRDVRRPRRVHEGGRDAEVSENPLQQARRAAVDGAAAHHVITGAQQREEQRRLRREPRGEADRWRRSLEQPERALERRDGGIRDARVGVFRRALQPVPPEGRGLHDGEDERVAVRLCCTAPYAERVHARQRTGAPRLIRTLEIP